jgi:hypothetical protein
LAIQQYYIGYIIGCIAICIFALNYILCGLGCSNHSPLLLHPCSPCMFYCERGVWCLILMYCHLPMLVPLTRVRNHSQELSKTFEFICMYCHLPMLVPLTRVRNHSTCQHIFTNDLMLSDKRVQTKQPSCDKASFQTCASGETRRWLLRRDDHRCQNSGSRRKLQHQVSTEG